MAKSASKAMKAERNAAIKARKQRKLLEEQIKKSNEKCDEAKGYLEYTGKNMESNLMKAKEALDLAIELYDNNSLAFFLLGEVYLAQKQHQSALDSYSRALLLDATHVASLERRAICQEHLNNVDGAIQDYTSIIDQEPNNDYAYNMRGLCILNRQVPGIKLLSSCFTLCEKDFKAALRLNKANYYALVNLGKLYEDQEELEQALTYYTAALEVKENYTYARFRRGCTYLHLAESMLSKFEAEEEESSNEMGAVNSPKTPVVSPIQKSSPGLGHADIQSLKQEVIKDRRMAEDKSLFKSHVQSAAKDFSVLLNLDVDPNLADPTVVLNLATCCLLLDDVKHAEDNLKRVEEIIATRPSLVKEGTAEPICDLDLLDQALKLKKKALRIKKNMHL
ncbi:unnamed protein product [Phytomonas sp. Hart1]|nr:unnamed protein product [Phytomonas sp. Hart1]|eukprot:CCW68325.1 unnamed protein product [Phytomonas sp. isolate Hart1]